MILKCSSSTRSGKQAFIYIKEAYLLDWFTLGVFGVILPLLLKTGFRPFRREVPLNDPNFSYPLLSDIVSTELCTVGSLFVPLLTFLVVEWRLVRRTRRWAPIIFNLHLFVLGLLEGTLITVTITEILKLIAGRPRPYFLSVCEPVEGSTLNCLGDAQKINEARKSFPSGHTSLSFAAAIYLSLYLMKVIWTNEGCYRTWHFLIVIMPILLASLVGVSRTIDYHHHFGDVVAGALLGTVISALAFIGRYGCGERPKREVENGDYGTLQVEEQV
eukprot:jgi/Galph1/3086/GphlegSOOS_G1704.1